MAERWLLVDEIAAHFRANPDTIYMWTTRKRLPAHKLVRLRNCSAFMVMTFLNAKPLIQSVKFVIYSLSNTTPDISDNVIVSNSSKLPILLRRKRFGVS